MEGEPEDAPKLAAILADRKEDDLVRAVAASFLGEMPAGAAHADVLVAAVDDESPLVRADAIEACGRLALAGSIAPIAARVKIDAETPVRRAAAVALGRLKGDTALQALLGALDDRDPGVQVLAAEALEEVTGNRFGHDVGAWKKWAAERTR